MDAYDYRQHYRGHQAAAWNFEPSAAGPGRPGVRFTSPGHAGGWLPLETIDEWADTLKAAGGASATQYANRANNWAA